MMKLTKSKEKMLCGVCGGIADYIGTDPTVIRILTVLLTLLGGLTVVIAYLITALIMPENEI